jgi:hypothetical protein
MRLRAVDFTSIATWFSFKSHSSTLWLTWLARGSSRHAPRPARPGTDWPASPADFRDGRAQFLARSCVPVQHKKAGVLLGRRWHDRQNSQTK